MCNMVKRMQGLEKNDRVIYARLSQHEIETIAFLLPHWKLKFCMC